MPYDTRALLANSTKATRCPARGGSPLVAFLGAIFGSRQCGALWASNGERVILNNSSYRRNAQVRTPGEPNNSRSLPCVLLPVRPRGTRSDSREGRGGGKSSRGFPRTRAPTLETRLSPTHSLPDSKALRLCFAFIIPLLIIDADPSGRSSRSSNSRVASRARLAAREFEPARVRLKIRSVKMARSALL